MHPLNNKYFGSQSGKFAVKFNNGNSVVSGYIVKQLGLHSYVVASNANTSVVRSLSSNALALANANNLALSSTEMTIEVFPIVGGNTSTTAEHAYSITMNNVKTVEGNFYQWQTSSASPAPTTNGFAVIKVI